MKKTLLFMMTFLSLLSFAQGTRIMYEYRFVSDLAKKDSADTELMYLDIKKDGSRFYSRQKFYSDSIRDVYIQKQLASGAGNFSYNDSNAGKVAYSVNKTYPDYKINLHTTLGQNRFDVLDSKPMNWKIESEKKKIDKFDVQKATLEFGGRTWTAWFSQDFPFQDGPYKFHGLPGLILEMEDSTGTHVFKFAGSKKFDEVERVEKKDIENTAPGGRIVRIGNMAGGKELEVTEDQFIKQWKDYKNDPVKDMRQNLSRPGVKMKVNINGKEMTDPAEMLRNMEKFQKEIIKNDNNKIEPVLYP
ncbi:GLPGLI family protein [Epilithonimonas sp. JDS]|uniref:GLPGLI family protein n=1 Tax=Epilithonimonas sp. JDS TaxID=2902797 RepID=UPI001E38D933|nr:GLPGLI family protein [Epilithonimonas sp. JDS]MCD9854225.1 GLPGLI family protein [Epilithonimonas sp. JDS]